MFRLFRNVGVFVFLMVMGGTVASSAEVNTYTGWYWPTCEFSGCGAYKGCPKDKPLCTEVENPCDYNGHYFPGGVTDALLCCRVPVNRIELLCGKDPAKWGKFEKMCECVCKHRDEDPYLKEHAANIPCPDNK